MEVDEGSAPVRRGDRSRLVLAFLIAPLVPPVLAAVLVFAGGMLFSDPKDTGTPVGIVLLPVLLLTVGGPLSYVVAGLVWWPVVWLLRKRGAFHFLAVHAAGLLMACGLTAVLALGSYALTAPPRPPLRKLLVPTLVEAGLIMTCTLAAVQVFWWLAREPLADPE
ncbi:MAG: hypothetical protein ACKOFW_17870 [Planctomycetaceae bacterium]